MAADESVLSENGKIDTGKIGMIFYESFSNSYYRLGEKVGKAWRELRKGIHGLNKFTSRKAYDGFAWQSHLYRNVLYTPYQPKKTFVTLIGVA